MAFTLHFKPFISLLLSVSFPAAPLPPSLSASTFFPTTCSTLLLSCAFCAAGGAAVRPVREQLASVHLGPARSLIPPDLPPTALLPCCPAYPLHCRRCCCVACQQQLASVHLGSAHSWIPPDVTCTALPFLRRRRCCCAACQSSSWRQCTWALPTQGACTWRVRCTLSRCAARAGALS